MRRLSVCAVALATLLLTLVVSHTSHARCPSNGNTHAIYVTSNMGNNIWSFDTQGNYLGPVLNPYSFPTDVFVDKLRTMRFGPGGHLYVSSARGSYSRVFAVSGNGLFNNTMSANCTRDYLFTVAVQDRQNPFLDHPYDIAFHPITDDMYVSNQNSATITRYHRTPAADKEEKGVKELAWAPAENVKAATEVSEAAVSELVAADLPTTVPPNSGLFAASWSPAYSLSSVRGLAISPQLPRTMVEDGAGAGVYALTNATMRYYLLVCDVAGNMVHVFDVDSGERLFGISVPSPIQVMFPHRYYADPSASHFVSGTGNLMRRFETPYMYVTSKDDGMAYMIRFSTHQVSTANYNNNGMQRGVFGEEFLREHRLYTINNPTPLHAASGIFEYPSRGVLLIADRNGRRISSHASPFLTDFTTSYGPSAFLGSFAKNLPDQPEFILSALLEHQDKFPLCYELNGDGNMRYVALCTAASIWSVVFAAVLVTVPIFFLFRQGRYMLQERNKYVRRMSKEAEEDEDMTAGGSSDVVPLIGHHTPNYGTTK